MHSFKLGALAAFVLVGCAQSQSGNFVRAKDHPPGALALTVEYTTLCNDNRANSTCVSIEYPQVCWTGTCTENCGSDGARSFHVCAPGGVRNDDPMRIDQRTSQPGLAAGTWKVSATSPSWTHECSTEIDGQHEGATTIDSAWRTCG